MTKHEPIAWIRIDIDGQFEFTSRDDRLGFAVYEKNAIDDLEQLYSDMIAINAGLKNKIDMLEEENFALEEENSMLEDEELYGAQQTEPCKAVKGVRGGVFELEAGQSIFIEVDNTETARLIASNINKGKRNGKKWEGRTFITKVYIGVATPNDTVILLKVSRVT